MERSVFPSKTLSGTDLKRKAVISAIHPRRFGELLITGQPLAVSNPVTGVELTIRLNGLHTLDSFWAKFCSLKIQKVFYHWSGRRAGAFKSHCISARCGVLLIVLRVAPTEWNFGGGLGIEFLLVGDKEILCSSQDQILEFWLLNVTCITTLNY